MRKKLILKGVGTSRGVVTGKVRIVRNAKDEKRFKKGEILVTKITDPTMVVMMNRAAGIVCDIGGVTSHPSILSRELGIPCIVNTKKGTRILQDGQCVTIYGETGEIFMD